MCAAWLGSAPPRPPPTAHPPALSPTCDVQVGKRGKVASRPSPAKQIAQLQAEEVAFQEALAARTAAPAAQPAAPARLSRRGGEEEDDDDDDDTSPTVPEQITDRMLRRMVVFAGVPVVLGILLLPGFYYLKKVQDLDVPVWAVYIVQSFAFGGGLAGITYGILSASWDLRREGSVLGWDEFRANLPLLMDRFKPTQR